MTAVKCLQFVLYNYYITAFIIIVGPTDESSHYKNNGRNTISVLVYIIIIYYL